MNVDFLKIGALIGIVVGFWNSIKATILSFFSLFIQRVDICTQEANDALISYLVREYPIVKYYTKSFGAINENLRNGKFGQIIFEKYGLSTLIFRIKKKRSIVNGFLVYIPAKSNTSQSESPASGNQDDFKVYGTLYFLRNTLNISNIMMHANVHHNANNWQLEEIEKKQTRFDIFYLPSKKNEHHAFFSKTSIGYPWYRQERHRLLAIKSTDIGRPMLNFGRALENLFFPDEIKELIFSIEQWKKNETWYKSKGIPWKRGWLLYGKPGTGKTALARAFAEDLNMPIYVFSLSQMNNSDLMTAWKNMQLNVPCIALIEDIDNVFHGRKNIIASNQMFNTLMSNKDDEEHSSGGMYLSFDCLLNCLDGVDKSNGVFTIITTNDISKVDEAIGQPIAGSNGESQFISTRPGRIDRAIELGFMNKSNKYAMAQRILADNLCALSEAKSHIEKNINETPAQFQEYCSNIALNHFWVKNHPN